MCTELSFAVVVVVVVVVAVAVAVAVVVVVAQPIQKHVSNIQHHIIQRLLATIDDER
jgi:small neutral amino acid transporter SnatA (MarC family)